MNTKQLLISGLIAMGAMSVQAGEGKDRHPRPDLNNDGVVTSAEMLEHRQAIFSKIDANKDGFLTKEEGEVFKAQMEAKHKMMREAKAQERFTKADSNGDGKVSAEEFAAQAQAQIAEMDADGNGELSRREMHKGMRDGGRKHGCDGGHEKRGE